MRVLFVALFFVGVCRLPLAAWFSQGNGGYAGEYLLSLSAGARGLGTGLAQTAIEGQSNLLAANPASLASLWWQEASITMQPLFQQGQMVSACYGYPVDDKRVIGAGFLSITSGDAEKTNDLGEHLGTFSDQQRTFILCYAHRISSYLQGGIGVKFMFQDMDALSERGAGIDGGILYTYSPGHVWGLSLVNLVPANLGGDQAPQVARFGFRHALFKRSAYLLGDMHVYNVASPGRMFNRWHAGVEYFHSERFVWRMGVNQKQVSAGFGVITRQMDLDYACAYHPLGFLHSFTLNIRYGFILSAAEKKVENDWEYLEKEKEEFSVQLRREQERVEQEREKLKRDMKLSSLFVDACKEYEEKDYDAAVRLLRSILKEDERHAEARKLLMDIEARQDKETLERRTKEAAVLYKDRKYGEALSHVEYVLGIQPGHQSAMILRHLISAQHFLGDKKYNDAKTELMGILKLDPGHTEATELLKRVQTVIEVQHE